MGITGVLSDITLRFKNSAALRPCPSYTSRGWKIDKGTEPSSSNGPAIHTGRKLHQWNLDSKLAAIHPSPFSECTKHDSPTNRLRPNLRRLQSLLSHFLFPSPYSRTHPGDTRFWRTDRIIAAPHSSLILRSRKRTAARNKDTSPPVYGTGYACQRKKRVSFWTTGSTSSHQNKSSVTPQGFLPSSQATPCLKRSHYTSWWRCGRITLTALSRNMTRPLRNTPSLGRTWYTGSTSVCKCSYTPVT